MLSTFFIQVNGKSTLEKEELQGLLANAVSSFSQRLVNHGVTSENISVNVNNFDETQQLSFENLNTTMAKFMERIADSLPKKEGWQDGDNLQ